MTDCSDNPVTYFARTWFRNEREPFGIKRNDRLFHIYVIGRTGTGKSTLIETMVRQDIARGEGLTLLDPHGDLVERIVRAVPKHRRSDVIYWNIPDPHQPYGYNPLKWVQPGLRPLACSGMLEVFHKLWGDRAWGQRMEAILRNALLALLEQPKATLPDILRLLKDESYRKSAATKIQHQPVRDFWLEEFPSYSNRYRAEAIAPIQSKIGAVLADPRLHRILTEPSETLSLRQIMDQGKVLLVNLSVGQLGSDSAHMLGGLLITTLGLAGFSRADTPEADRRHHWLYADEFQSFTTLSLVNMLSELRKFRVGMCMAHQYLHQLEPDIRHAVLGNAGTLITFRVGADDAHFLAREFEPRFQAGDWLNLPNHHIYLKLMIDGAPSKPFSAISVSPQECPETPKENSCGNSQKAQGDATRLNGGRGDDFGKRTLDDRLASDNSRN